jgi:4-hydroxymandelate oxidase
VNDPAASRTFSVGDFLTVSDFEPLARKILPHPVHEFIAGGAGDEVSLRANQSAFDNIFLLPRSLRDLAGLDTSTSLFGRKLDMPILLAPVAFQGTMHPEGELAAVRGAAMMGAVYVVSTNTTVPIEELAAAASGPLWFQLYLQKDRVFVQELIQRVEAAGCEALCVTVDTPVIGIRPRQMRARFELPPEIELPHAPVMRASQSVSDPAIGSTVTWQDIEWLRSFTKIRLLLKGVLHPDDAELALQYGVDGLIVSNHGARNLDTIVPSIDALPAVVEKVAGRVPVLVDGGIRRGTDVLKSFARGANAVLIGRPFVYALSVGGAEGVAHCLRILHQELKYALALTGRASLAELDHTVEWSGSPKPC